VASRAPARALYQTQPFPAAHTPVPRELHQRLVVGPVVGPGARVSDQVGVPDGAPQELVHHGLHISLEHLQAQHQLAQRLLLLLLLSMVAGACCAAAAGCAAAGGGRAGSRGGCGRLARRRRWLLPAARLQQAQHLKLEPMRHRVVVELAEQHHIVRHHRLDHGGEADSRALRVVHLRRACSGPGAVSPGRCGAGGGGGGGSQQRVAPAAP
jgi:hypothetical protein